MNKRKDNGIKSIDKDYDLIKAFMENDKNAFNRLVLKYMDVVFNLCYRLIGDYDEANDISQETFIKVYNNLHKFKFQSSFSTWLYRITVNTCKNNLSSLRFRMSNKMIRLDASRSDLKTPDKSSEYIVDLPDNTSNPACIYERKEKEESIQNAIDSLSGNQKILIVLRDIEGKSYEEIAEITGLKIGTVKSKLARARQELRDKLRGII